MNTIPTAADPKSDIYRCGTISYTKRGLIALFAWMLWGDFCFTLMETVVPSILPLKLRSLDSPNMIIGFIMTTLPGIFNIGITPWLSFKSDRHRGPMGRRIPFILYTAPFLTLSLLLIGFSDSIGKWTHGMFFGGLFSQAQVTIFLLAIFAAMFDLFNMFVNTVYWYLFNDVVPQPLMGRYMSWFRLVGTLTGVIYNYFIFQFAESHMKEIYLGAAALYMVGFGIMLFRVKEGQYPPPPAQAKKPSFMDNVRTFGRECYTMRFWWDINLMYAFGAMAGCIGVFNVFFMKSLGLDLSYIGKIGAISAITVPICLSFSGSLIDRWHPVRVAAYYAAFGAFFAFGNWVWLFIDTPPTKMYFWISALHGAVFGALLGAIGQTADLPRQMALYPRALFGQFCGAVALCRAPAVMIGGTLAGLYIDIWKRFFPDNNYAYRFNFLWTGTLVVVAFYFHYRFFRAWKRLGGDTAYQPPEKPFKLSELKPHPADTGRVPRGLIGVIGFAFVGSFLSSMAWVVYYWFFENDSYHAGVWGVATVVNVLLFLAFLRFIKFMERP